MKNASTTTTKKKTIPQRSTPKPKSTEEQRSLTSNRDKEEKTLNLTQTLERNVDYPIVPTIPEEEDQPELLETIITTENQAFIDPIHDDQLGSSMAHEEKEEMEENYEEAIETTKQESESEQMNVCFCIDN